MKIIEKSARTLEEAKRLAILELGTTENNVKVEILEEGSKGFLGFGAKNVKIRVTLLDNNNESLELHHTSSFESKIESYSNNTNKSTLSVNSATDENDTVVQQSDKSDKKFEDKNIELIIDENHTINFVVTLLSKMNILGSVTSKFENDSLYLDIDVDDEAKRTVIGKQGQTLNAIQYLASIVANKTSNRHVRVYVDTHDYRNKRKESLESLADRLAQRVKKTGKSMILDPMNPNERRIIHSYLHGMPGIGTKSEGEEPYRKVVIYNERPRRKR